MGPHSSRLSSKNEIVPLAIGITILPINLRRRLHQAHYVTVSASDLAPNLGEHKLTSGAHRS